MDEYLISPFTYWPWADSKKVRKKILDEEHGAHFFFRKVKLAVQAILYSNIRHENTPEVFLFGSPHIDNYTRNHLGCGLIDFDRAIMGPYFSDLAYALLSMSLKSKNDLCAPLPTSLAEVLFTHYQLGLETPDMPLPVIETLATRELEDWQKDTASFIEAKKGWVKKANKNPLPNNHPLLLGLLEQVASTSEGRLNYDALSVLATGYGKGSMGRDHYIYIVKENDTLRIIDIKPAKDYRNLVYAHGKYYHHGFAHEGERMVAASKHLAPHMYELEGYATLNGVQYWGREVPCSQMKLKELLCDEELEQFAKAAGVQMGQAHARSSDDYTAISKHFNAIKSDLIATNDQIQNELLEAWQLYCDQASE